MPSSKTGNGANASAPASSAVAAVRRLGRVPDTIALAPMYEAVARSEPTVTVKRSHCQRESSTPTWSITVRLAPSASDGQNRRE